MPTILKAIIKVILYTILTLFILISILLAIWYKNDIPEEKNTAKYKTPQSSFIKVGDSELHIRKRGSGPVIFLIHGSFSSLHTWAKWEEQLNDNYTTISMDLPSHGLTGPNKTCTYHTNYYSELLWALADSLKIDSLAAIAGNSMGGRVAWEMALKKPNRVGNLILVDASGAYNLQSDTLSSAQKEYRKPSGFSVFSILHNPIASRLMTTITPKFLFKSSLKQVYYDESRIVEGTMERYYDLMLHEGNRQATLERFSQKSENNFEKLSDLKIPSLILWGAKDKWILPTHAQYFNNILPNSKLIIYEDAGHVPMEEIPERSVNDVLEFLKEN